MFALDTYYDNLCLWRCIAVHQGARPIRCTDTARLSAQSFFKLAEPPKPPKYVPKIISEFVFIHLKKKKMEK